MAPSLPPGLLRTTRRISTGKRASGRKSSKRRVAKRRDVSDRFASISDSESECTAMQRDPQVDLIFSHFIPRYEATGVDPNDLRALMPRITRWDDWCRLWCEEGARHETLGHEAAAKG